MGPSAMLTAPLGAAAGACAAAAGTGAGALPAEPALDAAAASAGRGAGGRTPSSGGGFPGACALDNQAVAGVEPLTPRLAKSAPPGAALAGPGAAVAACVGSDAAAEVSGGGAAAGTLAKSVPPLLSKDMGNAPALLCSRARAADAAAAVVRAGCPFGVRFSCARKLLAKYIAHYSNKRRTCVGS